MIKQSRGRGGHSPRWAAESEEIIIIKGILQITHSPTAFLAFHFCPSESKVPLNTNEDITVNYWKGKDFVIETTIN
jgi:hypothetical protein